MIWVTQIGYTSADFENILTHNYRGSRQFYTAFRQDFRQNGYTEKVAEKFVRKNALIHKK